MRHHALITEIHATLFLILPESDIRLPERHLKPSSLGAAGALRFSFYLPRFRRLMLQRVIYVKQRNRFITRALVL